MNEHFANRRGRREEREEEEREAGRDEVYLCAFCPVVATWHTWSGSWDGLGKAAQQSSPFSPVMVA